MSSKLRTLVPMLIVLLFAGNAVADSGSADSLLVNADIERLQRVIDSYEGEKAVLVNIWATWCGPCVEEFPHIVELQRKYPEQLEVIFVSADFESQRGRAVDFLEEHEVDWTTYFKSGNDQQFINGLHSDWSGALPFTLVISKSGEEVAHWENKADFSTFERYAKQAMED